MRFERHISEIYDLSPDELEIITEQRRAIQSKPSYNKSVIAQFKQNCRELLAKIDPFSPREA